MEEKEINGKPVLPLAEYAERQKQEMLGADNCYFAEKELGHPPTPQEAAKHYTEHGGPEDFAKRFINAGLVRKPEDTPEPAKGGQDKTNEQP